MKNILLILLALIVTPAWADEAPTPPAAPDAQYQAILDDVQSVESAGTDGTAAMCPVTCVVQACPPPSGPVKLCCPRAPYTQTCP